MRYVIMVLLNLPVVFLAFINIITSYKLKKFSKARLYQSLFLWSAILVVLAGSFPVYNLIDDKHVFDSSELTLFDIVQTTVIVYLIYIINHQRQKIDRTDARLKELVQEISIKLSEK